VKSTMRYPSFEEVAKGSAVDFVRWNRFLRSPATKVEAAVLEQIMAKLEALTSEEKVRASKIVGWDEPVS
jgi:hypothetical protein